MWLNLGQSVQHPQLKCVAMWSQVKMAGLLLDIHMAERSHRSRAASPDAWSVLASRGALQRAGPPLPTGPTGQLSGSFSNMPSSRCLTQPLKPAAHRSGYSSREGAGGRAGAPRHARLDRENSSSYFNAHGGPASLDKAPFSLSSCTIASFALFHV